MDQPLIQREDRLQAFCFRSHNSLLSGGSNKYLTLWYPYSVCVGVCVYVWACVCVSLFMKDVKVWGTVTHVLKYVCLYMFIRK